MKKTVVICEPETEYAGRLMEYFNRKRNLPFQTLAFDAAETARSFMKTSPADVLLLSERFLGEEDAGWNAGRILILSEDGTKKAEGIPEISKYSSGDAIFREVMSAFDAEQKAVYGKGSAGGRKVFAVYSPAGGSGKTSFALTLGMELAKEQRVLYLNMETCPALETILGVQPERNLSDLIYFAKQDPRNVGKMLPEMTVSVGELDVLPPVSGFDDIAYTGAEEWLRILKEITENGGYDLLLIEPENGMQGFLNIMDYCTGILMPYRADTVSLAKIECFERMMAEGGMLSVPEKIRKVKIPFFHTAGLGRTYCEGLLWSELGDCARTLIREEKEMFRADHGTGS